MLDPSGGFLRRISSRNADINDNILSLQRDVRGNLWAGSLASGLYCLAPDGRIRHYTSRAGDTASISSGNVLLLCPLNADTLFVATEKGIDIYRYATDSFGPVCKCGKEEFAFYDAQIHGDKVWFINFCSVLCYDRRQRRIEEFQLPETDTRPYIQCGWVDGGGCLWLGTTKGDIWRFEEGRFSPAVQNHPQINGGIAGMRGDASGNLWLAAGNDLFRLDTGSGACAGSASPKAWASTNSTSAPDMRAVRARSASERRTGWSASGPRNSKTTSGSSRRFSSPG